MFSPRLRRLALAMEALPGRLAVVGCWRAAPGRSGRFDDGPQHRHAVPTLTACLAGVVRARGWPGARDLHPGEALLIAPGVWHRHEPLRAGSASIGIGSFGRWSDVALDGAEGEAWWGRLPLEPTRALIARAVAARGAPERERLVREAVEQVLAETVEALALPHPGVARMLTLLWSRLDRGIGAADLVKASGLGRSQAYALFTATYGVSPRRAVEDARSDLAATLRDDGCGPDEIAAAVGMGAQARLQRMLRRRRARG